MPHKRKVKKDHDTKLIFQPELSYLYLRYCSETTDTFSLPLDSLLPLFVIKFIHAHNIKVVLVEEKGDEFAVKVRKSELDYELCNTPPEIVSSCRLPVWYLPGQQTCLAGLCSVIRYTVKLTCFTTEDVEIKQLKSLLGHQMNCLSAPAEVSTWTKFCELDLPQAVSHFLLRRKSTYPEEFSKLEAHLRQPLRIHNVRKRMQDHKTVEAVHPENGTSGIDLLHTNGSGILPANGVAVHQSNGDLTDEKNHVTIDPIQSYAKEQHVYAEGPDMLISDILLYPYLYLVFNALEDDMREKYHLISRWFDRVSETGACHILESMLDPSYMVARPAPPDSPPQVRDESLYKCDPKRETVKTFTHQSDVERNLRWWQESGLENLQQYEGPAREASFDWSSVPRLVHPQAGELPPDRLERKCHQLQGLVLPLLQLARRRERAVIVDFCSGGGHLGLLLAYLLPQATVHMVENKEESLARARERGMELNLRNVWYFQANLEYYQGRFDIGSSLHACGVATDLVIQKCIEESADFVCSPCCYGGVRTLHNIQYPRSRAFQEAGCVEEDYIKMGHTADQTEKKTEKEEQGELFMDIVDTDRALHCSENNYDVLLTKIYPLTCSPKHNLIIASLMR